MLAPIVVIAFNRPNVLKSTLDSLANNKPAKESELYVFVDGPREGKEGEKEKVARVVEVAKAATGFKRLQVIESPSNKGLAKSIICAASEILDQDRKSVV